MDTSIVVLDYGARSPQPNVIGLRHRDLGPTTQLDPERFERNLLRCAPQVVQHDSH